MQLDPLGIAVTGVQVIGFILLLIGVYPTNRRNETVNLIKHGFLSTLATVVNLAVIFAAMIPVFARIVAFAPIDSFAQFPVMWLHAVIGSVTIACAIAVIVFWVKAPLGELGCAKTWRLMKPILAIWAVSIVIGAFILFNGLT